MKKYQIEDETYELIKDYKNAFELEQVKEKYTEYFKPYDYILGDWSYGKLRLKGFCDKTNKKFNQINDFNTVEKYIKENCAYDCQYFILKQIKNNWIKKCNLSM